MSSHSVADAKNNLSRLIDSALQGEAVTITRHGKPVVELRSIQAEPFPANAAPYAWLRARRLARRRVSVTSVDLLNQIYEDSGP